MGSVKMESSLLKANEYRAQLWGFLDSACNVPERLSIVEWIETRRHLTARSEESGPMRISRTPYVLPWLEAAVDDLVEEIVVCASAQVSKTTFAESVVGYYADQEKAPILFTLADENTAKFIARDRVRAMFAESPELQYLIDNALVDNAQEMQLSNGAYIAIAWASSVASLASREFRIVIGDEIDKPGYYVKTKEATSLSLMRERTASFYDFKRIFFSTPTIDSGNVTRELETCDAVFDWHVPCPHCGQYQPLRFSPDHAFGFKKGYFRDLKGRRRKIGRIVWKGGSAATPTQLSRARYQCGSCKKLWSTAMKDRAVGLGKSVPRSAVRSMPKKVGFHINRIYSLLGKSGHIDRLVDAFIKAKKDPDPRVLQGFINSSLAEPWRPVRSTRTTNRIMRLMDDRPRGRVPGGGIVSCLLAGVDTQDDGFYFEIRAFGYGEALDSWCVREGFALSMKELEKILWSDAYVDADGQAYPVKMTCQDAMGHRTAEVYDFCAHHRGKIFPTQGVDRLVQPFRYSDIEYYPGTKIAIPGGVKLVRFDTNFFKNKLHATLNVALGDPGAWAYHSELTEDWAQQMTVEGIGASGKWENPGDRPNHAWDVAALLMLAAEMYGVKYSKKPGQKSDKKPKKRPRPADGIKLW
jgi:phage terminase large subunit GpA-like protein